MPEVHVPQLEDDHEEEPAAASALAPPTHRRHGKSIATIALEVILISGGVCLGLMGEQWREEAHQRELAATSLQRFRTEIVSNRKAVNAVTDYHATLRNQLNDYFASDKRTNNLQFKGLGPVFFEQAAWDLALATQSLVYIDPELAFTLSRVYTIQKNYAGIQNAIVQSTMYGRSMTQDSEGFLRSVLAYLGDVSYFDPAILEAYDKVLPQIDEALADE